MEDSCTVSTGIFTLLDAADPAQLLNVSIVKVLNKNDSSQLYFGSISTKNEIEYSVNLPYQPATQCSI